MPDSDVPDEDRDEAALENSDSTPPSSEYHNDTSIASDPGQLSLSVRRFRSLRGGLGWFVTLAWRFRGIVAVDMFEEHLQFGDSRAAVVMKTSPLRVAAYTDELDCVAMLGFPAKVQKEHQLSVGDRLLTVNTYYDGDKLARDLHPGPGNTQNWTNFYPLIAEFLSDDVERIATRKSEISESEWQRCRELGEEFMVHFPELARDGSPVFADYPASEDDAS